MKKFLISLFIFLSPVLIIISIYLIKDPFKVLYHYDNYYAGKTPHICEYSIAIDRDFVSTQVFINNYHSHNYHSYIFGNSRSTIYELNEWRKYINDTSLFLWDASGESLYGIERKFQYIDDHKVDIRNALIIIDPGTFLKINNESSHVFIKHIALSGQKYQDFQLTFLKDFLDPDFLRAYIIYLISGKISKEMDKKQLFLNSDYKFKYDENTNGIAFFYNHEKLIQENEEKYFKDRKDVFNIRDSSVHYHPKTIEGKQDTLLKNIKRVLEKYHVSYKFVIGPAYTQKKIDTFDLKYLQNLFGKEKVFDFSGKNEFTNNIHNFYENSHYRPIVTKRILNIIYSTNAEDSIKKIMN